MFYTLYKITNKINGKIYIGTHKTDNLDDGYFGSGSYLKRSIKKYGIENFTKEIMYLCRSAEEMFNMEALLVDDGFTKRKDTYNIKEGGSGGFGHINKSGLNVDISKQRQINPDIIKIASKRGNDRKKELLSSDNEYKKEFSAKVSKGIEKYYDNGGSNGWSGKTHTDETKIKIGKITSQSQKGSGNSQYGTIWITDGTNNRKIKSDDTIPNGWKRGRIKISRVV